MEHNPKELILWFDSETTGDNPNIHGIHQMGFLVENFPMKNSDDNIISTLEVKADALTAGHPISEWDEKQPDGTIIKRNALEISNVTPDQIRKYQDYSLAYQEVIAFFKKHIDPYDKTQKFILAGYNVKFDKDMLEGMAKKNGDKFLFSYIDHRVIDILPLARTIYALGKFPSKPKSFKLEHLCELFDININAHDAVEDIKATRTLMFKLLKLNT